MSGIRDAIRSKLRALGERSEDNSNEDDKKHTAAVTEMKSMTKETEANSTQLEPEENFSIEDASEVSMTTDDVQEMPIDQLQEQLLSVMIQNQELERSLQEQERIRKLYEHEKEKCKALEDQLRDFVRQTSKRELSKHETPEGFIDVAQEVQEETDITSAGRKRTLGGRLQNWMMASFYNLIQDFTEEPDPDEDLHDQQLAIKTLKTNITRFKEGTQPIYYTIEGFRSLFAWHYPITTFVMFSMYMYAVWTGWLLPFILMLILTRLTFNFLITKGFNINVNFLSVYEEQAVDNNESFSDMGVSDKFTVVLAVATKVQNALGYLADNLEKLWNLLTWQQCEATVQLYFVLSVAFVLSCFLSGTLFFMIGALYLGFKMFIVEFIYLRFPRVKQKHDSVHILWKNLPTNAQLQQTLHRQAISRKSIERDIGDVSDVTVSTGDKMSVDMKIFCDIFSLPYTETPLKDWHDGKGCALIDKDKGLSLRAFKYGKLFLTKSFICFERQRKQSPRNITIPLTDITDIKKVKPYSWMPGTGMSIEISTSATEKPYLFGAMLSRDEVCDAIISHALSADLSWASAAWQSRGVVSKSHDLREGSKESVDKETEEETRGEENESKEEEEIILDEKGEKGEKETELRQRAFRMSDLQNEEDDL